MITERRLMETRQSKGFTNIQIGAVHGQGNIISRYDYSDEAWIMDYFGPCLDLSLLSSGVLKIQWQFIIKQLINSTLQIIGQPSINISISGTQFYYKTKTISPDIDTTFLNTQISIEHHITISKAAVATSTLAFNQQFNTDIFNVNDTLLTSTLQSISLKPCIYQISDAARMEIGCIALLKGEATYQPSIIGKALCL